VSSIPSAPCLATAFLSTRVPVSTNDFAESSVLPALSAVFLKSRHGDSEILRGLCPRSERFSLRPPPPRRLSRGCHRACRRCSQVFAHLPQVLESLTQVLRVFRLRIFLFRFSVSCCSESISPRAASARARLLLEEHPGLAWSYLIVSDPSMAIRLFGSITAGGERPHRCPRANRSGPMTICESRAASRRPDLHLTPTP
jgi:hypothetical protein